MGIWSSARRVQLGLKAFVQSIRARQHTMRFGTLHELEVGSDGELLSTGYGPRVELISDQAEPPRRWCWLSLDTGPASSSSLPRLLVYTSASLEPERFLLTLPTPGAGPILLRLPDDASRTELLPSNHPGRTNLHGVRVAEVGKGRLLLRLIRERPRVAWRTYRATPSFVHFKTKLIEDAQRRLDNARGLDWLSIYESGVHPRAISWRGQSRFSVVISVADGEAEQLKTTIASVMAQSYPRWTLMVGQSTDADVALVVQNAMKSSSKILSLEAHERTASSSWILGDTEDDATSYVVFLNANDILEPHALARFADAATRENADLLYGDRVSVEADGTTYVALEALPAFSHAEYLRSSARIHPVALRTALACRSGALQLPVDHIELDAVLRALEQDLRITHIPDILSRRRLSRPERHMRRRSEASAAALRADHLRRLGYSDAEVSPADLAHAFAVRHYSRPTGRVLAIVPTKDRHALLQTCIDTVRETTRDLNVDIVVVNHESTDAPTLSYLESLPRQGVRVLRHEGPFNYSVLNNTAVSYFGVGYEYYLFLNNDIEAKDDEWLAAMLDLAMQPDVGVVGATLLYPDLRIQHAGVVVGMVGAAEHTYRFARLEDYDDLQHGPRFTREYSAVTGACMLVKSAAFQAAGGFDDGLAVGFNDTDLCLRIKQMGYRVLNCGEAVLVHHESASRGKEDDGRDMHPADTRRFMERHARILQSGDPFFSPLLDRKDPLFTPKPNLLREQVIQPRTVEYVASAHRRLKHG